MSDTLDTIRARWAGADWHYAQNAMLDHIGEAWVYQAGDPPVVMVDLGEPNIKEVGFLSLAAQAPGDIRVLLAAVAALSAVIDAKSMTIARLLEERAATVAEVSPAGSDSAGGAREDGEKL